MINYTQEDKLGVIIPIICHIITWDLVNKLGVTIHSRRLNELHGWGFLHPHRIIGAINI